MDMKKLSDILKKKLQDKAPATGEDLDKIFNEWWDGLTEDERFEVIKKLLEGTPLEGSIAKCGCSGGAQRCAVAT